MRGHPTASLEELVVVQPLPALLVVVVGVLNRLAHPGDHRARVQGRRLKSMNYNFGIQRFNMSIKRG